MAFPATGYLSDSARTRGEMKTAFEDFLAACKQIPGAGIGETTLTIATGSVTPTLGTHAIDTESAASTDDLTTIAQTNIPDGGFLLIHSVTASRVVVVKHGAGGAGQIILKSSADFSLSDQKHYLFLKRAGAQWDEVFRNQIGDSFAPATAMLFDQNTAPVGWTRDSSVDDRVVKIQGSGTPTHGGSWTISGLTADSHTHTGPSHTHTFSDTLDHEASTASDTGTFITSSAGTFHLKVAGTGGGADILKETFSGTTDGGGTGNTGTASANGVTHTPSWRPLHRSVIRCTRN